MTRSREACRILDGGVLGVEGYERDETTRSKGRRGGADRGDGCELVLTRGDGGRAAVQGLQRCRRVAAGQRRKLWAADLLAAGDFLQIDLGRRDPGRGAKQESS
jgi:hypothetical protein